MDKSKNANSENVPKGQEATATRRTRNGAYQTTPTEEPEGIALQRRATRANYRHIAGAWSGGEAKTHITVIERPSKRSNGREDIWLSWMYLDALRFADRRAVRQRRGRNGGGCWC